MVNDVSKLVRAADALYLGEIAGRAGSVGVSLGADFVVSFDFEHEGRVVGVFAGNDCDYRQVATVLGEAAADQISGRAPEAVVHGLPDAGRCAAEAAMLERLLEVPVLRDKRCSWAARLVLRAQDLIDLRLDADYLRTENLRLLPRLIGPASDALQVVRFDEDLTKAIVLGSETLDRSDDEWEWCYTLAQDLPDPNEDSEFVAAVKALEEDKPLVFRGDPGSGAGAGRELSPYPLYWTLVAEHLLPDDDGFDGAISLSRDERSTSSDAIVRVACPGEGRSRPAIFARVVALEEVLSVDVLLPTEEGWQGSMPLPTGFDPRVHRVEVTDSVVNPVVTDPVEQQCEQWVMLAKAQSTAGRENAASAAWARAEALVPSVDA